MGAIKRWRARIDTGNMDDFDMAIYRDVIVEAKTKRGAARAAQDLCGIAELVHDVIVEKVL